MRIAVGLTLAAFATLVSARAEATGPLDTAKRDEQHSTDEKAVLPENKPIERNEVLMDKHFKTGTYEKKEAIVGERRSSITVEETRDKKLFVAPEPKKYETIERKDSAWMGKESRFSTGEDAYRSKTAVRFQDKIGDAMPFNENVKPVVSKRTTFDKINRFVFRRNGGDGVSVTKAGSNEASRDISGSSSPALKNSAPADAPPPEGPNTPSAR